MRKLIAFCLALTLVFGLAPSLPKNGHIVDGGGNAWYRGDEDLCASRESLVSPVIDLCQITARARRNVATSTMKMPSPVWARKGIQAFAR